MSTSSGPRRGCKRSALATDPRVRLATLQTAVPFNLVLHAAVRVPFAQAHAVERRAHKLLADVCARNEWFHATPAEAIAAVEEAANPPKPVPPEWRPAQRAGGRACRCLLIDDKPGALCRYKPAAEAIMQRLLCDRHLEDHASVVAPAGCGCADNREHVVHLG